MFAARNTAYMHHEFSWMNEDDKNPDLDGDEDDLYTDEEDGDDDESEDDAEEHAKRKRDAWKTQVAHWKNEVLPKYFPFSMWFKNPSLANEEKEKEKDYYRNSVYHPDAHYLIVDYLEIASVCHKITTSDWFNNTIIFVIFIAGLNVGVQTYDLSEGASNFFSGLDIFILTTFIVEFVLKVVAEGLRPWYYWVGDEWKWNNFDFIIIILLLPFMKNIFGGGYAQILRLVRLARMGKLIRKVPPLQRIVKGIAGGMASIGYILILMFIVFYLYAIVGYYIFGQSDPYHFGSVPHAMLILYRIATLENWTDILYINIHGCDVYANIYVQPEEFRPKNELFWCTHPMKSTYAAPIYFCSFVIIASFVLLSLFVGTITMSMNESMEDMKRETDNAKKQQLIKENSARIYKLNMKHFSSAKEDNIDDHNEHISVEGMNILYIDDSEFAIVYENELIRKKHFVTFVRSGPEALDLMKKEMDPPFDFVLMDMDVVHIDGATLSSTVRKFERRSSRKHTHVIIGLSKNYNPDDDAMNAQKEICGMNDICDKNVELLNTCVDKYARYAMYERLNNLSIDENLDHWSSKLLKLLPESQRNLYRKFKKMRNDAATNRQLSTFEMNLQVALGQKSPSEVLFDECPPEYELETLKDKFLFYYWHLGHKCLLITSSPLFTYTITAVIIIAGASIGAKTDPRSQKNPAFDNALDIIDNIIQYVFLVECMLKILAERYRPNRYFEDPWNIFDFIIVIGSFMPGSGSALILLRLLRLLRIIKIAKAFPQLAILITALFRGLSSIGWVGVILALTFYCFAILGVILFQESDPWHFGSLHLGLISLFRSSTLDNWYEVLMISMLGCDGGGQQMIDVYELYPEQCTHPARIPYLAVPYTLCFLVIASQVLLVLFIGVISASMDEARAMKEEDYKMEVQLSEIRAKHGLTQDQVKAFTNIFDAIDLENDRELSPAEVEGALEMLELGVTVDEMKLLYKKLDPEMKGIHLADFIRLIMMTPRYIKTSVVYRSNVVLQEKKTLMTHVGLFDKLRSYFGFFYRSVEARDAAAHIITRFIRKCAAKKRLQKRNKSIN